MPRLTKRPPTNSILASAANLPTRVTPGNKGGTSDWQKDAWAYFQTVGELSYAAAWYSNCLSRVTLTIKQATPDGPADVTTGPAADALTALYSGGTGQSQMLSAFGVHLFVPGECYLIGLTARDDADPGTPRAEERWGVYSTEEVKKKAGRWVIDRGDGNREAVEDDDLIIRIWRPHPRKWVEAQSPVRAVLTTLQEIQDLSAHIHATAQSRLAGAGILLVPSEMTFTAPPGSTPPDADGQPPEPQSETDAFMIDLTDAMITPIKDRGSAAAVVPVMVKAPGAILGNIKHISFATPLDDKVTTLRDNAIRRLALGLDLPPEVLTGVADVNHWTAWQVDEAALKVHIEPVLELICSALTERFLWPVLDGQGINEDAARSYYIDADTSELRSRPNRSNEAFQLHDILAIDDDALLRETGFDEADKPTPDELRTMLLRRLAVASTDPAMAADALAVLGVDVTPDNSTGTGPTAVEEPTDDRSAPEAASSRRAIQAVCEVLVGRACERARNRVHHRAKTIKPVPTDRLDEALAGAWVDVPRVATLTGLDPDALTDALDRYTRAVLAEGIDHVNPRVMARVLALEPA